MASSPLGLPIGLTPPPVAGDAEFEFANDDAQLVDGAQLTEDDDGGVVVDFAPQLPATIGPAQHNANLAATMQPSDVNSLGALLLAGVEEDKRSRGEWETTLATGMKLLGLSFEDRTTPFAGACGVFDPLMAEAVIRFQAVARGELMPAAGPCKTEIIGFETPELKAQASRVSAFMNLYLTQLAPEYYEDFDQMLMWLGLVGSMFKKVYQDPVKGRPVAPFVTPENMIVAYGTTDLTTAQRFCHIAPMTRKQLRQAQMAGLYLDQNIGEPQHPTGSDGVLESEVDDTQGVRSGAEGTEEYRIFEVHADLELKGDEHGLPCPYIVSIDENSTKVLSIRRNWREGDPTYARINRFVHYKLMPGFGFYGIGYAHLLGNSAKAATTITRQLVDAGTLANFPGGLRVKGMRMDDNDLGIGPTEFREIDTGGMPIEQAIKMMPYKEPSDVLMQLGNGIRENARNLANTAEIAVGEGRQDAPVGTTMALMEAATRVQSAEMKRCHKSLGAELKMIADLFGEYLPETPYPFPVRGGESAIMRQDFASNIDVVPVSDPNIGSSAQRMMRAQGVLTSALQSSDLHDMRTAYENFYAEMGLDPNLIERLLPPAKTQPVPLDPLTENQNALMNMPLKAGESQDHDAHIAAHAPIAGDSPALQAHINEHLALKMRVQVQQLTGPLPPPGTPLPPEVENQIAMAVAQAMQQLAPQYKSQPAEDPFLVIEREKLAQRDRDSQRDSATKVAVAEIQEEGRSADIDGKIDVEVIKTIAGAVEGHATREASNGRPES